MSYERGWAAFNLQAPAEIPHTQYITRPAWLEQVRREQGKPGAGCHVERDSRGDSEPVNLSSEALA